MKILTMILKGLVALAGVILSGVVTGLGAEDREFFEEDEDARVMGFGPYEKK